jgi:hypothetical protein
LDEARPELQAAPVEDKGQKIELRFAAGVQVCLTSLQCFAERQEDWTGIQDAAFRQDSRNQTSEEGCAAYFALSRFPVAAAGQNLTR